MERIILLIILLNCLNISERAIKPIISLTSVFGTEYLSTACHLLYYEYYLHKLFLNIYIYVTIVCDFKQYPYYGNKINVSLNTTKIKINIIITHFNAMKLKKERCKSKLCTLFHVVLFLLNKFKLMYYYYYVITSKTITKIYNYLESYYSKNKLLYNIAHISKIQHCTCIRIIALDSLEIDYYCYYQIEIILSLSTHSNCHPIYNIQCVIRLNYIYFTIIPTKGSSKLIFYSFYSHQFISEPYIYALYLYFYLYGFCIIWCHIDIL